MSSKRALHFVFKIGNRQANTKFYRDLLGLKVIVYLSVFCLLYHYTNMVNYEFNIITVLIII